MKYAHSFVVHSWWCMAWNASCITFPCGMGNLQATGGFSSQMASCAECVINVVPLLYYQFLESSSLFNYIFHDHSLSLGQSCYYPTACEVTPKDMVNSLWPSDTIWRQRSRSTLVQVMACCLKAPSHYLNQCWLIISEVLRHSPEGNFTGNAPDIYHWYDFGND